MKPRLAGIIVCVLVSALPALAQQPKTPKPASAAAAPRHPAKKTAPKASKKAEASKATAPVLQVYAAMPAQERRAIQADLAWIGDYQGPPTADFDAPTIDAVRSFQKRNKGKATGLLSTEERAHLAAAAKPHLAIVGWRLSDDIATGVRLGIPAKLVPQTSATRIGSHWSSAQGQIQIETFRLREASLPALFDAEKKTQKRSVESSSLQPAFFMISGTQGLKNFVVRADAKGGEVRGVTVLYDQATAGTMSRVAVAAADLFQGFPDANAASPGLARTVGYGTAMVASANGDLLAIAALTAGCETITVAGFGHAVRIAADKNNDLALLRLYGARNLVPATFAAATGTVESGPQALTLAGMADPRVQPDNAAVTEVAAQLTGQSLQPMPPLGFSGAAALDAQRHLAGIADLDAPATDAAGGPVAALIPAAAARSFLLAHGIAPAAAALPIAQSLLRVICVRK